MYMCKLFNQCAGGKNLFNCYIRLGEPVPRLPLKWRAGRDEGFAQVKCLENRTDRWDGLFMGVVMP